MEGPLAMTRFTCARLAFWLLLSMVGVILSISPSHGANTNADYAGVSPFVASTVTPNILIMLDNSGSMGYRTVCDETPNPSVPYTACPTAPELYPAGTPAGAPFIETVTFSGLFDALACYTYDQANSRFVQNSTKATITTGCASTAWDGNFLNWATFRRHDALKKALIGAQCVGTRLADSTCPPTGSPALLTIKGEDGVLGTCCANASTAPIPKGAGANNANGRVPTAIQGLVSSASLVIHLRGFGTLPGGGFCVGRSNVAPPATNATNCGITSSPTTPANGEFLIHMTVSTEPTGVIQQLGGNARFGLLEFRVSGDGGKVLVPIGSNQATPYDVTTVTTYNSNKAAMVAGIEQTQPATATPLAETLYTGIRYIAQVAQPYSNSAYLYPIAFSSSGGPAFQPSSSRQGSLGPSEQSVLSAGETCPAGYIAGACGRDPYFFGSSPAPGWISSSQQVLCCKTFIMFLTDGEANDDQTIPAALQDYAHAAHGSHCSGTYAGPPASNPTTAQYTSGSGCFMSNTNPIAPAVLMAKHKVDYPTGIVNHTLDDVAYWGHINDLRQAVIPGTNEAGHDLPGMQNVTIYPVFAFGNINGRELLMQAARQGGFDDQNGNNLPDLQSEWDRVDNLTGLLLPDGIPDTYFESQNANDIKDKLLAAVISILQKSASGTSASVLASSATGEGASYQAYFFPNIFSTVNGVPTQVAWTGYNQGLFMDFYGNIREDYSGPGCTGPPDGKLVLSHDCIIKLRIDPTNGNVLVDRYKDDDGDGIADSTTAFQTVTLRDIQPIWEAGRRLALTNAGNTCPADSGGVTCRRILTWMDISNSGGIGPSPEEYNEFAPGRVNYICPYLGGALASDCNSSNPTNKTNAQNEATNIINWIRGNQVTGLRDRQLNVLDDTGTSVTGTWKLGDVMNATPVTVGAPRERYDIIYGDAGYARFYQRYKDRRQVSYTGANDGMMHAFNAGFLTFGDDTSTASVVEKVRFTTVPMKSGTSTPCGALPCDASVAQYNYRTNNPNLGAELWGFIPQDLLPQLRWLTMPNYSHVYYVDLTPKITDVRIFADDADHPGGWGTILIGGFRLGGSCTNCTQGKSGPRVVNADFNYDGDTTDTGNSTSGSDTRVFLSSYFVLDVTNPEKDPVLLWVLRDKDLGLTTVTPSVLRVNPAADPATSSANEKWYVVFGTGPTHIDGSSGQTAKMFIVDLKQGPNYTAINQTSGTVGGSACSLASPCIVADATGSADAVRVFSTGEAGASMGSGITIDVRLDYRVDVIYAGVAACNASPGSPCGASGPQWRGALYRLTTNQGNPDPDTWGWSGAPTRVVSTVPYSTPQGTTCTNASPCKVGPVLAHPAAAVDDAQNLWLYFGTGRFYANSDKTNVDKQHYYGVKDCVVAGTCDETTERNNLVNMSNVVVCSVCTGNEVTGLTGVTNVDGSSNSLVGAVTAADGWFSTLPVAGERNLSGAKVLGGSVFFTSFVPTNDMCVATGQGYLYALYYLTGTAYKSSVIGTTPSGSDVQVLRSIRLNDGMPSEIGLQLGRQGTGAAGASSNAGSSGRLTGFMQSNPGGIQQLGMRPAIAPWSRIIAWRDL
jgi:type IV pilus assembly protein PilY1